MNNYVKILLFGFITWLVPFIAGLFFYDINGNLIIEEKFFKSIMLLLLVITSVLLLVLYYRGIRTNSKKEGYIVGISWFFMNFILDLIILIPISGMNISTWFAEIGLRYMIIPIISIGMGYVEDKYEI